MISHKTVNRKICAVNPLTRNYVDKKNYIIKANHRVWQCMRDKMDQLRRNSQRPNKKCTIKDSTHEHARPVSLAEGKSQEILTGQLPHKNR